MRGVVVVVVFEKETERPSCNFHVEQPVVKAIDWQNAVILLKGENDLLIFCPDSCAGEEDNFVDHSLICVRTDEHNRTPKI